jgi:autotransporter adhesin
MASWNNALKLSLLSSIAAGGIAGVSAPQTAHAQALTPLVDVCTGISLPRSALTDLLTDINTPLVSSLDGGVNAALGFLGLPGITTDVSGIIAGAAGGAAIGVSVLDTGGTIVGPGDCNLTVDGVSLNSPQGISIGGNAITGLGSGTQASAGALDAIAFGNNAQTGAGLAGAIAIGTNANTTAANSVALGAGSLADRANAVSVGAAGNLRQITNVADGTAATDAATVGQVAAAIGTANANAVQYTDATHTAIVLDGVGGTTISGVAAGTLDATSTEAVNGAQLFATNQAVAALDTRVTTNETAITNLDARVTVNEGAITNLQSLVANVPVGYVDDATGTIPSATPTNTVAFEGATAAPVRVTNVAAGNLSGTSTDAVNGAQLYATNQQVAANTTTIATHTTQITSLQTGLANVPVQYSNPGTPTTANGGVVTNDVTLVGASAGPVALHNVGPGVLANDAVNFGQFSSGLSTVLNNANAYTDARLAAVGFDLRELRKEAFAGTAGALAAAGLPQVNSGEGSMIAGAVGHYRGQTAFAVGFSSTLSERSVVKINATIDTHGYAGVSGGAGFAF